ncbi:MAG: ATP synthase subunit I [Pseudomonadota bacterium]
MKIQQRMLMVITRSNWVLFGAISVLGAFLTSSDFALGMICGGLMVTVNFHMLYRTLKKALTPPYLSSHHVVIAKYYVRFVISGIIIFLLISKHIVDPVGLIIGLSVVVASILFATFIELKKMIFKEAV